MNPHDEIGLAMTRRQFFSRTVTGIGTMALGSLVNPKLLAGPATGGLLGAPHFAPKAKRVIYLFQAGAPSQMDLFDHKPNLRELQGSNLPNSIRRGQRLTGMTSGQKTFPVASSKFEFERCGDSGIEISSLLPFHKKIVDEICVIKTIHTEAINHDPAITFFQTGSQQPGRASIGSWMSYGLGSENQNLPAFVVLVSQGSAKRDAQALYDRLWGSGFLPSRHQGVNFRSARDPVIYLTNPPGIDSNRRREMIDVVGKLNRIQHTAVGDPEIMTRIAQYEMAYRMQTSVPDLIDTSAEPDSVFEMYGPDSRRPGTYAANCVLARRLIERGVRFVQLFHRGWDQHFNLPSDHSLQCRDTDQPSAALVMELKERGLLDETLVVWGGEFGRTVYCQGKLTATNYGRDHHPRCFSIWMAGGGIQPGLSYGETDDYCYNIVANPVHVHDLHATILHCMGIDHEKLTFKFQGRNHRLTDVHGHVVHEVLG